MVRYPLQRGVCVDQAERLIWLVMTDIRFHKLAIWQGLSRFFQHGRRIIHAGNLC